jgi:preprotein translocase subunit Sss1
METIKAIYLGAAFFGALGFMVYLIASSMIESIRNK